MNSPAEIENNQLLTADRWLLAWWLLVGFLTALAVWPLWVGDFLPLHDAAQVQHQASVIWDWNVEAVFRRDFVRAPFPCPNWFGIALLTVLAPLGGVVVAHKIVLSLCIIGVVGTSALLVRQAGHSRWLVVAALPWAWHHEMYVGHLAHCVGLPMFLGVLAAHLWLLRQPGPWRALTVALLLALLSVTHFLLWLCALAMVPLLAAAYVWPRKRWSEVLLAVARDGALVLPSLALVVHWTLRDVATTSTLRDWAAEFRLPVDALRGLFGQMFDVFAPRGSSLDSVADLLFNRPGDVITALWLLGAALWSVAAVRTPRGENDSVPDGSRYLAGAALLAAVAYFALPTHLYRPVWIHSLAPRMAGPMLLLAVLALRMNPVRPPKRGQLRTWAGSIALVGAATWLPVSTARSAILVQPEFDHLRQAMAKIEHGKAVLVLRPRFESHWMQKHIFTDIGQYAAVLRGAAVPHGFVDPLLQPVRAKSGRTLPSPIADNHDRFTWHEHGRFYDYIALFRDPFAAEPRYEALLRSWPRVYQRGKWQVFQNLHPEAWPPPPTPQPAPADRDQQLTEAMMEALGPLIGLDWHLRYPLDEISHQRDELLRAQLGLASRAVPPPPEQNPSRLPPEAGQPDGPTLPAVATAVVEDTLLAREPRLMVIPPGIVAPMPYLQRLPQAVTPTDSRRPPPAEQ